MIALAAVTATGTCFGDESEADAAELAAGSASTRGPSLVLLAGYGTDGGLDFDGPSETGAGGTEPNHFGPALGMRFAYTFQSGFVAAAALMHHFGGPRSPSRELTSAMLEAGWELPVGRAALEPFLALGWGTLWSTDSLCRSGSESCTSSRDADGGLAAGAGLMATFSMSDVFFVGARAQVLGVVGPELGFTALAAGGARL